MYAAPSPAAHGARLRGNAKQRRRREAQGFAWKSLRGPQSTRAPGPGAPAVRFVGKFRPACGEKRKSGVGVISGVFTVLGCFYCFWARFFVLWDRFYRFWARFYSLGGILARSFCKFTRILDRQSKSGNLTRGNPSL